MLNTISEEKTITKTKRPKKQSRFFFLFTLLAAICSCVLLTGCDGATTSTGATTRIFGQDDTADSPSDPYSKKIGSVYNIYLFHNFIGEEPDIIPSTAKEDVKRYLEQGVTYLQSQFDDFYESVSDRAGVQRYFAQFKIDFSDVPEIKEGRCTRERSDCEKMDYYINLISEVCEPVMTEILNNLPKSDEHDAMILCYRVLANEVYREALGSSRNSSNTMMEKYNKERTAISALWDGNSFLKSISLESDLDPSLESRRCARTADKLYTLLHNAANSMKESNKILGELSMKDLQYFITLNLNASSLEAMHDFTAPLLKHEECFKNDECT